MMRLVLLALMITTILTSTTIALNLRPSNNMITRRISHISHSKFISGGNRRSNCRTNLSGLFSTNAPPIDNDEDKLIEKSDENNRMNTTAVAKQHTNNKRQTSYYPPPPESSTFPPWSYAPRSFFEFEILHQSTKSAARVGRIHTPHGTIDTPSYVAVATNAALKGVDIRDADIAGQQLIFCNTYHLLLQPGMEVVEGAGGLHKFMNRKNGPLITDSGGFQVFSLAYGSVHEELSTGGELKRRGTNKKKSALHVTGGRKGGKGKPPVKVTEEGAIFRSYRDGKSFLLTPESTVQAQKIFGADIIIPLDELPPYHIDRNVLINSVERTHRWEARSLTEHLKDVKEQAMYCVIHGGMDRELRKKSVDYLTSLPFDVSKEQQRKELFLFCLVAYLFVFTHLTFFFLFAVHTYT